MMLGRITKSHANPIDSVVQQYHVKPITRSHANPISSVVQQYDVEHLGMQKINKVSPWQGPPPLRDGKPDTFLGRP